MLQLQLHVLQLADRLTSEVQRRRRFRGDAGEVTSTVIIIAILCTLAIAVGAIIFTKVKDKADSIPMG